MLYPLMHVLFGISAVIIFGFVIWLVHQIITVEPSSRTSDE